MSTGYMDIVRPADDALTTVEAEPAHAVMDIDASAPEVLPASGKSHGILGSTKLPSSSDPTVLKCTSKAPRTLGAAFSFRASVRGGLIALPVVRSENGGSFRVKLLRLKPELLSASKSSEDGKGELSNGVTLLESHREVSFAKAVAMSPAAKLSLPRPLIPSQEHGAALLAQYLEKGKACLGTHAYEAFELLSALLGDSPEQAAGGKEAMLAHASQRFGVWLAQVNARTVNKHLTQSGTTAASMELAVPDDDSVAHRLKNAFHRLTANSVRGALQELGRASGSASEADSRHAHFDRLATILASCGGTACGGSVERRQWLKRQVLQWRSQSVDELMGPALWRIYCLLAGDVDSVVADALDWRTTFGMYLWYRSDDEQNGGLLGAVNDFDAICKRHGKNCGFRPAPPYLLAQKLRDPPREHAEPALLGLTGPSIDANAIGEPEVCDLQFSVVRAALGLVDWSDFQRFDYMTYSSRPMDVAGSWHFCLLLLALSRPDDESSTSSKVFQQLTQQYCLSLELSGNWDWAVYVANFVRDDRTRTALLRGLLQRHSALAGGLALPPRPYWSGVPTAWIWHGEAMRRERMWEWPAALACWLRCLTEDSSGDPGTDGVMVERAMATALGFLLMPAILKHRVTAPALAAGGQVGLETTSLASMTGPASWLLAVLTGLEGQLQRSEEIWARVGRDVLLFMREWSAGSPNCSPARLAQLCKQCSTVKERVLGIPWR
jgi:hypothetical protein